MSLLSNGLDESKMNLIKEQNQIGSSDPRLHILLAISPLELG
jgi:hypothetical protein